MNRGSQNLQIIVDKGESQKRSNSTLLNTFSPNQTRTPSSAGKKAQPRAIQRQQKVRTPKQSKKLQVFEHFWPNYYIL